MCRLCSAGCAGVIKNKCKSVVRLCSCNINIISQSQSLPRELVLCKSLSCKSFNKRNDLPVTDLVLVKWKIKFYQVRVGLKCGLVYDLPPQKKLWVTQNSGHYLRPQIFKCFLNPEIRNAIYSLSCTFKSTLYVMLPKLSQ